MTPRLFSAADRAAFEQAAAQLGPPDPETLRGFLDESVWNAAEGEQVLDDPLEALIAGQNMDETHLRAAGSRELACWLTWLDGDARKSAVRAVGPHVQPAAGAPMSAEILDAGGLRSLQATLLEPDSGGVDLGLRAGLHRLARCLADVDPSALGRALAGLDPQQARCLRGAHARLNDHPAARQRAGWLRAKWIGCADLARVARRPGERTR